MENTANFILPGMYEHFGLNCRLIELMETDPEIFRPGVKIGAVYGNFQFCIFDGGRIFSAYRHTNREEMEFMVSRYNKVGIPVRLIFTNPVVPETSFRNRFGQATLEVCNASGINEIVVNNDKLGEYIRNNYSGFSYISSTTKCLSSPAAFREEFAKPEYKMVCLDYNLNHNQKMLDEIAMEDRSKCEFLVNAICPPGCPNRKEHYRLNGLFSLNYGKSYTISSCGITNDTLHPVMCNSVNNISPEDIFEKYVPNGFVNFKLEGRTLGVLENACNYARYMIKPEYQLSAITDLISESSNSKIFNNYTTSVISDYSVAPLNNQ